MSARKSALTVSFLLLTLSLFAQRETKNQQEVQLLADHVFNLSEVMLHDVVAPPVAARFYSYAMLGAYEVAHYGAGKLPGINEKFTINPDIKSFAVPEHFNLSFASNYAILQVGRQIMPSGYLLEEKQKSLIAFFKKKKKIADPDIQENVKFAEEIAKQVMTYARGDAYNKLSTHTRYRPSKKEGHWYPTPPEYMAAVEPQWKTVRPFFLDSAAQFAPPPPAAFSKDSTSSFYRQMMEVYNTGKNLTTEQRAIASFWDCNPFAVTYSGHMAIGLKKISPGGHWMGIAGIACKKADIPLDSAILVNMVVAMTLHDAFISCWEEKYNSDRIRPEAAINNLKDPSWRPLLQTPPFPEYTSGHSVASSSVAVVLTHLLGDNFSFVDTSELYFGLPARPFKSFYHAADEAAISRLYGGIHFRDACENGLLQGKQVGRNVISKLFNAVPQQ